MNIPYKPYITMEDLYAFRADQEETHTASPLMNAVAYALSETKFIWCEDFAEYLQVDRRALSSAILLETGLSFIDIIRDYRLHQIDEYIKDHPNENLEVVAKAHGYSSKGSLWRFFQRRCGNTPLGKKSQAGRELWLKWREDHKR